MFYLAFLRRKFGGAIFYCDITASAPTGHDGDVISSDMGLPVSCAVCLILAVIAAGHIPHGPVLDLGDQCGVFQVQVSHQIITHSANILCVAFGVGGLIFLHDHLRGMGVGDIFALKTGNCRRVKHVLGASCHLKNTLRHPVQPDLPGQIVLRAGTGDFDIVAN